MTDDQLPDIQKSSATDPEFLKKIVAGSNGDILSLFFELLPNPKIETLNDDTKNRINVCGILLTELRERAVGNRNVAMLQNVHVLAAEITQVAQHLTYKSRGVSSNRLWTPGMPE